MEGSLGFFGHPTWCLPEIGYPENIHFNIGFYVHEFSTINQPFWGTPILGNLQVVGHTSRSLFFSVIDIHGRILSLSARRTFYTKTSMQ